MFDIVYNNKKHNKNKIKMQYVKVAKGEAMIKRKVRFFVEIKESGEQVPCINATQVTKTLKDKMGLEFSTSDVYNWTNPVRRKINLTKRGFGDGFMILKVPRNKNKHELADERLGLAPIAEEESGDGGEDGGEQGIEG